MAAAFSRERIDVSTFAVGFLMLVVLILSFSGVANAADLAFRAQSLRQSAQARLHRPWKSIAAAVCRDSSMGAPQCWGVRSLWAPGASTDHISGLQSRAPTP
jgi:hypothetical protein